MIGLLLQLTVAQPMHRMSAECKKGQGEKARAKLQGSPLGRRLTCVKGRVSPINYVVCSQAHAQRVHNPSGPAEERRHADVAPVVNAHALYIGERDAPSCMGDRVASWCDATR